MKTMTTITTTTRRLALFALILALPLALVACGGDADTTDDMPHDEAMQAEGMDADGMDHGGMTQDEMGAMDGAAGDATPARMEDGVQVVEITAGSMGYRPERVRVQAGVPVRLVMRRTTASQCLEQVQIPELGIERTDLPMNEPVTFEFTPEETGTFQFVCGMDMQHGTVVVES